MCEFCNCHAGNSQEFKAEYIDGGIILFKDRNLASGYFDINYCPICGRMIDQKKTEDSELVPLQQVLDDMYNPDGGYASMAARDYYYQFYATADEQKKMDREDKLQTAFIFIFTIVFLVAISFNIAGCF